MDKNIEDALIRIREFNQERDWGKYHTGSNLAKSISIEAGELLELYQWGEKEKSISRVKEELGDVLIYCFMMADLYGLDPMKTMLDKLEEAKKKYPADKFRGKSEKYDEI